ncbi:MAG TPA: outer membrane beta-barrel protein [Xanthobacteraceae bacterium]|nr:outer membrane beta-barrel protein [Xanthobacteraceae bacterium]
MRAVILGLASLTIAGNAVAADYLRGSTYDALPSARYDWSGVYAGAQWSYSSNTYEFNKSTRPLVADILRQTLLESEGHVSDLPNLPKRSTTGSGFGFFVGYNSQWGDAVVGLEVNYNRVGGGTAASSDIIGRVFETSDEFSNNFLISSSATARLTDIGSLRMRLGYAWGWVMPYGMFGLAIGRVDAFRTATVNLVATDASDAALDPTDGIPPRPGAVLNQSRTESRNGVVTFGYMLGAGVDIGLFPGVFVRGEWEYAQLNSVLGIPISVNSFRVGAAVKY